MSVWWIWEYLGILKGDLPYQSRSTPILSAKGSLVSPPAAAQAEQKISSIGMAILRLMAISFHLVHQNRDCSISGFHLVRNI